MEHKTKEETSHDKKWGQKMDSRSKNYAAENKMTEQEQSYMPLNGSHMHEAEQINKN